MFDLPLVWGFIIAFGVCMYVILDGFDLGIGILFQAAPGDRDRDIMMSSVAPVWDGNETWLVLGGAALLGAFPLAYAVILSALYLPLTLMLIALIFRGVAFEFRFKAEPGRRGFWDAAFNGGSIAAAFCQGLVLGSFIQGFPLSGRDYAGGAWDWLTLFSLAVGLAMVCGYALLGATWLVMKSEGALQDWARRTSRHFLLLVIGFMGLVSLWTPFLSEDIYQRWFSWPNLLMLSPVPLAVAACAFGLHQSLRRGGEVKPFLFAIGLFLLGYLGLAISLWPYIIPRSVTIWDAASAPESQSFMLVGVVILLPVILAYTAYAYWVFRGKTRPGDGYH